MEKPILIDKPLGATPLQALSLLRGVRGIPASEKLAYAGRLDPLATGLLAVVYGTQLAHQEDYWYLPKQYEAEIVLGIATDSYDLMGMPTYSSHSEHASERITSVIRGLVGKIDLSVPIYSSHRYQGAPLFTVARSQPDRPVVLPVRRMTISQIDITKIFQVPAHAVVLAACERTALVQGDFRQQEISAAWQSLRFGDGDLQSVRFDVQCGSGTYIRSLAHEIGRRLSGGAVLSGLRRTRIGAWRVTDPDVTRLSWPQ